MKRSKYSNLDLVAEMVKIATSLQVLPPQIFPTSMPTKLRQLYDLYAETPTTTDAQAIRALYGTSSANSPAFMKLKHELKKMMRAALLDADYRTQYDDAGAVRLAAYIESMKEWSLFWVLREGNRAAAAAEVGERLLPKLLKYDFSDLALRLTTHLARFHVVYTNDAAKTKRFLALQAHILEQLYWDVRSDAALSEVAMPLARGWGAKPHLQKQTEKKVNEMIPQLDRIDHPRLQSNVRLATAIHKMNGQHWAEAAEICREAITFLRPLPESQRGQISSFYSNLIICLTHLGEYAAAQTASDEQLGMIRAGSLPWIRAKEVHATMCFRSGDYDSAQQSVIEARDSEIWNQMQPNQREPWYLFEAWLTLLHTSGHLEELRFTFRRGRFLNQVPEFSKDKRGMNINLILVQILFLLQEGSWEAVLERFDALGKYNYRMVRRAGQLRSYHFIRMALAIPKVNFQRAKSLKVAARFMPMVSRNPVKFAAEKHDLEIIEFEKIWEIMREFLPKKAAQIRKAA